MPSGHASDRATAPGKMDSDNSDDRKMDSDKNNGR